MQGESRESRESQDEAIVERSAPDSENDSGVGRSPASATASESPEQAQSEAARLKDAWLRTAADFDNFKKRTRREIEDARRAGREDLVKSLLPVFDNLERALQSAQRSTDVRAMADGLALVQRQFADALGREAIVRVQTVGRAFDPTVHEAIQQVETDEHPPGTILAEVQPGYTHADRLLRAAMVVVARPKAAEGADDSGNPSN
jgi:molecular chaperone GrpE